MVAIFLIFGEYLPSGRLCCVTSYLKQKKNLVSFCFEQRMMSKVEMLTTALLVKVMMCYLIIVVSRHSLYHQPHYTVLYCYLLITC